MLTFKKITAALLVTLAISGIAAGSFAAYQPAAVFAGTSNLPGEWDVG